MFMRQNVWNKIISYVCKVTQARKCCEKDHTLSIFCWVLCSAYCSKRLYWCTMYLTIIQFHFAIVPLYCVLCDVFILSPRDRMEVAKSQLLNKSNETVMQLISCLFVLGSIKCVYCRGVCNCSRAYVCTSSFLVVVFLLWS